MRILAYDSATIFLTLLMSTVCSAQSLIMQLPADGHWATYRMENTRKAPGGGQKDQVSQLTVRILGTEGEGDSKRRWIEIENVKPDGVKVEATRFLVPQANIGKNLTVFESVKDFDHWRAGGPVRTITDSYPFSLEPYFAGKVEQIESLAPQSITTPMGEFKCEGIRSVSRTPPSVQDRTTTYTCYLHAGVPFGSVKFSSETEVRNSKQVGNSTQIFMGTVSTNLLLEKWGTDAKSEFPHR